MDEEKERKLLISWAETNWLLDEAKKFEKETDDFNFETGDCEALIRKGKEIMARIENEIKEGVRIFDDEP